MSTPDEINSLLAGPASKPPLGLSSNFSDPPSLEKWLVFGQALWMTLSTLAIAMRFWTQWFQERKSSAEDYIIFVAWTVQIGVLTACVFASDYGIGRHMWDVRLRDFIQTQYYENIVSILYVVAMCAIKLAILLQILRVFVPNRRMNKPLFYGCWIWISLILVFYTVDFCLELAQCVPREKIWNPFFQGGTCVQVPALYEATGVFNVVSDFAILLSPLPTIYQLQCGWKKKLAMGGVFATGFFVCIISTLRTWFTWRLFKRTDVSWEISFLGLWTWAELCVGSLVFCLPVVSKFFKIVKEKTHTYILSRLFTSRQGSSSDIHEPQEVEEAPAKGKQQSKQLYPQMMVSLASWEQPERQQSSGSQLGNTVSISAGSGRYSGIIPAGGQS